MFGIDFKGRSFLSNVELSFLRNFSIIVYFISTVSGFIHAQNRTNTLRSDGAWCWFSDPRAIYYKGEKEQIYFGYINSVGDVLLGVKDIETGAVHEFV
ncbi:MAG: hypothetical protein KDC80_29635, partial [Saprospiraceae bacterium]|nr:hypothetical protein [Saprospiraceae bacterium]